MNRKKHYEAPVVEVIEAHVEKGFAGSDPNNPVVEYGTQQLTDGNTYLFD